ncbi:protein kinase domain-containing protein [Thermogemmatispora onikobensis]|uniref:protein kinase domain-containing protein n=1 Tax=Thermogemmatispora onikobensis TaxID=732234 RepID=UPI0008533418|nr:ABC transporter substrate-binding protein [Thermogemmatispora onikobensis]
MECPHCGAANRPEARFCSSCGHPVLAGSSSPASSQTMAGPLMPGTRLQGGRYEVVRLLGRGASGAALLAIDHRLNGKRVVIKELLSETSDPLQRQEELRQFKREVALLAHLDHPLIPAVTDHFQEGERYFMVEEYIEGQNLEELLERRQGPLGEREALIYATDIIDILAYLELQTPPVVHCDIKPAKIVIGASDGHAYLVGFGVARAEGVRSALRRQTSAFGTPGYAPPEQYQGKADPRSDLYALAATLHQLLTGRDPRNYPPFSYPAVRSLNPQLSPEIERILLYALQPEPDQRYQSATAMQRDIEALLFQRFGAISGTRPITPEEPTQATGNFGGMRTTGGAGPLSRDWPGPGSAAAATFIPPASASGSSPVPAPFSLASGGGGRRPFPLRVLYLALLLLVIALVIVGSLLVFLVPRLVSRSGPASSLAQGRTITPPPALKKGLGAYSVVNPDTGQKDYIGLSDGSVAFDVARPDGDLKQQAARRLQQGDISGATALWQSALDIDSNDAEALIYLEDQRVLASGSPYITLVVATILTGNDSGAVGTGRDNLQGAYLAQKEYNSGYKLGSGVLVRLLIANSGGSSLFAATIAQQIVLAARADKTIVGVMGWPYSSRVIPALPILSQAQLPMVSPSASSDQLSGKSAYFFRVCPSDQQQGAVGADYAYQHLRARRVALFLDPLDPYSQSLANAFSRRYVADGGTIVVQERYRVGKPSNLPALLQDALMRRPDLLYFSGYASDVATLLTNLPTTGSLAGLQVMGGDALYQLQGYPSSARAGFLRLHFTAFAYPDEWGYLALPQPAFFTVYPQTFNANSRHAGYGYTRPDNDAILSYDATLVLLEASRHVLSSGGGKTVFGGPELRQALAELKGNQAVQGISGVISFGSDGNPDNKAVVVLMVDNVGHIKLESVQGRFLK